MGSTNLPPGGSSKFWQGTISIMYQRELNEIGTGLAIITIILESVGLEEKSLFYFSSAEGGHHLGPKVCHQLCCC